MASPAGPTVDEILEIEQQQQLGDIEENTTGEKAVPGDQSTPFMHDLNSGYEAALENLLSAKSRLKKLKNRLQEAEGHQAADEAYVAAYERYVKKVKAKDQQMPKIFSCSCLP